MAMAGLAEGGIHLSNANVGLGLGLVHGPTFQDSRAYIDATPASVGSLSPEWHSGRRQTVERGN
jgi:hypothetical protein